MTEITTAEALNVAKRLVNQFQSLEKIAEVLEAAQRAENSIPKLTRQAGDLKREISTLEKSKSAKQAEFDDLSASLDNNLTAKRKETQQKIRDMEVSVKNTLAEHAASIKETEDALMKATEVLNSFKSEAAAEKSRLQGEVDSLNKQLSNLKSRIENV